MAVTVKDVARQAGTSPGTVSQVLNRRKSTIRVSDATKQRVLQAVKVLGYHPNAAARSLSMSRTGNIGFILSDNVTDGLSNAFFSQQLSGVELACRELGYGLHVSLYNLSNLDTFVFPDKIGQRSVDGLLLGGYVEAAVVRKFKEFGIPSVCIGDNTEVSELIPTVSVDILGGLFQAVEYAAGLGHCNIGICFEPTRRGYEIIELFKQKVKASPRLLECKVEGIQLPNARNDYNDGKPLVDYWLNLEKEQRPSLLMATDQTLIAAIGEFRKVGIKCPEDISLLSLCDSALCKYSYPSISVISSDYSGIAYKAAEMLMSHLGNKGSCFGADMSRNDFQCKIIPRSSCAAC